MKTPNSTSAATIAAPGTATDSIVRLTAARRASARCRRLSGVGAAAAGCEPGECANTHADTQFVGSL